jgi:hypothetical protein
MRTILIVALLTTASAHAAELQFSDSGTATCIPEIVTCATTTPVPFSVSFDLNSTSGTQTYQYNPAGVLTYFSVGYMPMTNYTATLNGQPQPNVYNDFNISGIGGQSYQMIGTASGMYIEFADLGQVTKAELAQYSDPFAGMMLYFGGSYWCPNCLLYGYALQGTLEVSESPPTSVPEPPIAALLAVGLAGLLLVRVRKLPYRSVWIGLPRPI